MQSAPPSKGRAGCVQGGWDPLAGIGKSHGVCWVEGKRKNKGTLSRTRASPLTPNLMVHLVKNIWLIRNVKELYF